MKNPKPQVSGSSYSSTSQLSEAPDIKKWFSSYTYQSPELATNEDFCFTHGVDDEEKRLFVEDSETEDEGKCEAFTEIDRCVAFRKSTEEARKDDSPSLPAVEVQVYPDSLSLPSEPPDITNWFSSYVYESPELESSDFDVSLSSGYTLGCKEEFDRGRKDPSKDLPLTNVKKEKFSCMQTVTRPSGVENSRSPTLLEDASQRSNLSTENQLCPERISGQRTCRIELENCNNTPDRLVECPNTEVEDFLPRLQDEQQISRVNHLSSSEKTPYSRGRGFTESGEDKLEKKFIAAENDSGWISLNHKPREAFSRRITKERGEYIFVETLCNPVKNKARPRINKENSPAKSNCFSDGQKNKKLRREILKETTNFDLSHVPEIAGKWKCPQKYKPNTGAPMKQLRLERWVHKI